MHHETLDAFDMNLTIFVWVFSKRILINPLLKGIKHINPDQGFTRRRGHNQMRLDLFLYNLYEISRKDYLAVPLEVLKQSAYDFTRGSEIIGDLLVGRI